MALDRQRTFFGRLARDRAGNVMAMAAAALVPLLAMVGGGIDASRTYMAYTRLQQACDSGALAGRKAMNLVTVLTSAEQAKANEFFDFNFPAGTYSSTGVTRSFTKGADGVVNGTATATMPTTIMKLFGYSTIPLSVTCQSTLNIPNTDVMFVLDVTGSMDQIPSGDTVKKIDGLKSAVKDFYSALGPGTTTGPGRIRYGFVPYSSNVNVGKILYAANPGFLVGGNGTENYHYQSRVAATVTEHYISSYGSESSPNYGTVTSNNESWSSYTAVGSAVGSYPASYSNLTDAECTAKAAPNSSSAMSAYGTASMTSEESVSYPDSSQTRNYTQTSTGTDTQYRYARTGTTTRGTCQLQKRTRNTTDTKPSTTTRAVNWADREKFDHWNYQEKTFDVSSIVQNSSAANPAYYSGYYDTSGSNPNYNRGYYFDAWGNVQYYNTATTSTISWGGCVEEADTVNDITSSSSLTPSDDADDLKIDLVPSDTATRWRPFLPQVQFDRSGWWLGRNNGWIANGFAACPREASRLTMYASDYVALTKTSASFNSYVDSLSAVGGTYHDIGLIWGARFLSPDGIFAADNRDSAAPGAYQVSRHIVFMTDGQLDTRAGANDPWGINNLDGRIAATSATDADVTASHERRTQMICNSMKGKGFTIWVIGFGITDLSDTLKDCASDSAHWSVASNSATLRTKFSQIAMTIGGLRLSQ